MKSVIFLLAFSLGMMVNCLAGQSDSSSSVQATTFESGETQSMLIELFTSEGCSSCPPADAWLSRLKSNPDLWKRIVPVAFHVDYWNRLGWMDRFSRTEFTDRQRRYTAAWGTDSVYTPNFVVNGREWKSWYNGGEPSGDTQKVGRLKISLTSGNAVTGVLESVHPGPVKLDLAFLGVNIESDIRSGENSGRKLRHDFIALSLLESNMVKNGNSWTGTLTAPKFSGANKPSAIAAWVSSAESSTPIQATGGWLPAANQR